MGVCLCVAAQPGLLESETMGEAQIKWGSKTLNEEEATVQTPSSLSMVCVPIVLSTRKQIHQQTHRRQAGW